MSFQWTREDRNRRARERERERVSVKGRESHAITNTASVTTAATMHRPNVYWQPVCRLQTDSAKDCFAAQMEPIDHRDVQSIDFRSRSTLQSKCVECYSPHRKFSHLPSFRSGYYYISWSVSLQYAPCSLSLSSSSPLSLLCVCQIANCSELIRLHFNLTK